MYQPQRWNVYETFFFSSGRRHTRWTGDWSSDVCSSDLPMWPRRVPGSGGEGSLATIQPTAHATSAPPAGAPTTYAAISSGSLSSRASSATHARRQTGSSRSEERRVGQEGSTRGAPDHYK